MEERKVLYAIRLPSNQVLEREIHLYEVRGFDSHPLRQSQVQIQTDVAVLGPSPCSEISECPRSFSVASLFKVVERAAIARGHPDGFP